MEICVSKSIGLALFCFSLYLRAISKYGAGAYIWRGDLTEGFLRFEFRGLIHEGAYLRYPSNALVAFIDTPIHLVPAMFSLKTAGY